ncbi:MAG: hypothetical protein AAGI52_13765 [Bacteroidota bacterium]
MSLFARHSLVVTVVLAALAGGCSVGRSAGTTIAPHVIFLAPEGCGVAVAKIHRAEYALIQPVPDDPDLGSGSNYVPRVGDVLEGPVREGESIFRFFPPGARNAPWSEGQELPLDVIATGLPLPEARAQLDARCIVGGEELPRLPGTR